MNRTMHCLQMNKLRILGSWSNACGKKPKGAFHEPAGHRIVAWLGKAALKSHALQTLRDCRASPKRAKRLECVRFIGAFRRARDGRGSSSQCTVVRPRGFP